MLYAIGNFKHFFFLSHNWNCHSVQSVKGICLLVKYLNSRNCLLELKWAVEHHVEEGVPIIVILVDPLLSFETISKMDATSSGAGQLDRRTLAFVNEWLLGVKIYTKWIEGDKGLTKALESKVKEMLGQLN